MAVISERTKLEMERGRRVLASAEISQKMKRFADTPGVTRGYFHIPMGNGEVWTVNEVEVARVDRDAPDYPSDVLIATLSLAIQANAGLAALPQPEQSFPRYQPDKEAKEYNARLKAANAHRWGD